AVTSSTASRTPAASSGRSSVPASAEARLQTPARILDAAFACVAELGLGRTTMDDVARRAAVSRQTVYRYYPSKDQLVVALVLREEEKFLDGIRAALATHAQLEPGLHDGMLFRLPFPREPALR